MAGAAFRLWRPSPITITVPLGQGDCAELNFASPYIVVRLATFSSAEDLQSRAQSLAERALDLCSAAGLAVLSTEAAETEAVLWWKSDSRAVFRIVDTISIAIECRGHGNVSQSSPAQIPLLPTYHQAYRFVRLSQLTDDLFDAYRNAYLALELLVSDQVAKSASEGEPAWLRRAFSGALAGSLPGGVPAADFVDAIYSESRLQLFHAKARRPYFLPLDSIAEREQIRCALRLIRQATSHLLSRVSPHVDRRNSSMSRAARARACRAMFCVNSLEVRSRRATATVESPEVEMSEDRSRFDNPTLVAACARVSIASIDEVTQVALCNDVEPSLQFQLAQAFSLSDVNRLEVLVQAEHWPRAPRAAFPR